MRNDAVGSRFALAGVLALLAALAGGAEPLWATGLVLGAAGLLVLSSPQLPRVPVLFGAIGLLVLLCGSALLPVELGRGAWREQAQSIGLDLPATISPQPFLVLEGLLILLGVACFCIWILGAAQGGASRISALRIWSLLTLPLAAVVIWGNLRGWVNPLAPDAQCFSLFPNRNQTALMFAMMANVGWGFLLDGVLSKLRRDIWLGGLLVALSTTAVILLPSRAALALLFMGLVLQMGIRLGKRDFASLKLAIPLLVMAFAAAFSHGGHILERISSSFHNSRGAGEFRLKLWNDTVRMMADHPWTGVGLGNFEQVFVHYRDASSSYLAILHPESDWLWLAAEAGIPAAIIMGLIVAWLLWRGFKRPEQDSVEAATGVAVLLALLHSLVDVPFHRLGTLFLTVCLYGVWAGPAFQLTRSACAPRFAAVGGLLPIVAGSLLLLAYQFPLLHSRTALDALSRSDASKGGEYRSVTQRMLLDWRVHFAEGVNALELGDFQKARSCFRKMRFLSSNSARPAFYEGLAWLPYLPREALTSWRAALDRPTVHELEVFQEMVHHAFSFPELWPGLARLSDGNISHRNYLLLKAPVEVIRAEMQRELQKPIPMNGLSSAGMTQLQLTLIRRGMADLAEQLMLQDSFSDAQQWRTAAHLAAARKDLKSAVAIAAENADVPQPPSPEPAAELLQLQKRFLSNPNDVTAGLELLHRNLGANPQTALQIIERLKSAGLQIPHIDAWEAFARAQLGEYEQSWALWQRYLN